MPLQSVHGGDAAARPVSALIDHPWMSHPERRVIFVVGNRLTTVVFGTGQVPWRMRPLSISAEAKDLIAC
jgi:hypothetical protein